MPKITAYIRSLSTILIIGLTIIILGLPSRIYQSHLPHFYTTYIGDALWAALIYILIVNIPAALKSKHHLSSFKSVYGLSPRQGFAYSITFTYLIELTQLYQASWIQSLRQIKPLSLILGHRFSFADLLCYTIGIGVMYFIDKKIILSAATKRPN